MTTIARNYIRDVIFNGLVGSKLVPPVIRWRLLRLLGFDVQRSSIGNGCFFGHRARIHVAQGARINHQCFFDGLDHIHIGRDCEIAMQVSILTSSHEIGTSSHRAGASTHAPVTIGDGAWIGARATIMPGVTIGEGCVIAAGALVTRDCEPDTIHAGVPARQVRELDRIEDDRHLSSPGRRSRST